MAAQNTKGTSGSLTAVVDDLKHVIKKEWPELDGVATAWLKVFAVSGTSKLHAHDPILTDATGPNPLVLVTPQLASSTVETAPEDWLGPQWPGEMQCHSIVYSAQELAR